MSNDMDERKRQILLAALEAFTAKGYDKTTMDDIVRVSGLSKGSLYWHFKNKQALFRSLIDMVMQEFMDLLAHLIEDFDNGIASASETIHQLFTSTADMMNANPHFSVLTVDFFLQAWQHAEIKRIFASYYRQYIDTLSTVIRRGIERGQFQPVNAWITASAITGIIDGIAFQMLLAKEIHSFDDQSDWNVQEVFATAGQMIVDSLTKG